MAEIRPAVKALIRKGKKYLILEQEFNGTRYSDLPGGKVEYGESPYDTLLREVKEEVFLDINIIQPLGMWWFFREVDKAQIICNTFLCEATTTDIDLTKSPVDEHIINYYWLEKEDLLKLKHLPHNSLKELFEQL